MKFELTKPCKNCPFRWDCPEGWLGEERAEEIAESLVRSTFSCHQTNEFDEETSEAIETEKSQHCAGALIMLEHMEEPSQMMRIAERLGMYDRTKLKMDSPVFEDTWSFIEHHA